MKKSKPKVKIVLEFDSDSLDREYGALAGFGVRPKFCSEATPEELFAFVKENLFDESHCLQAFVEVAAVLGVQVSVDAVPSVYTISTARENGESVVEGPVSIRSTSTSRSTRRRWSSCGRSTRRT